MVHACGTGWSTGQVKPMDSCLHAFGTQWGQRRASATGGMHPRYCTWGQSGTACGSAGSTGDQVMVLQRLNPACRLDVLPPRGRTFIISGLGVKCLMMIPFSHLFPKNQPLGIGGVRVKRRTCFVHWQRSSPPDTACLAAAKIAAACLAQQGEGAEAC